MAQLMLEATTDRHDLSHLRAPLLVTDGQVTRPQGVTALRVAVLPPGTGLSALVSTGYPARD